MGKVTLFLLCAFVGFMPFEMLAYFGDLPSGAKLVGALILASAILAVLVGHRLRWFPTAMVIQIGFVTWCVCSLAWSAAPEATLGILPRLLQFLVFALIIWQFAVTYPQQLWLLRAYVSGMFVPIAMEYASRAGLYHIRGDELVRLSGGGHDPNYLAAMYAITIIAAVYMATNPTRVDRLARPIYWLLVILAGPGVILTGSKSGFVCLVAAIPFALVLGGVSLRRVLRLVPYGAMILVVAGIAYYIVPAATWMRSTQVTGDEYAMTSRLATWERGLGWGFGRHPVAGVGYGAFAPAMAAGTGERAQAPHNLIISILAEVGAVGMLLYALFIGLLVRAAWRLPWREKVLWLGVLCVWFIMSMAVGNYGDKLGWFLQAMVLAQSAAFGRSNVNARFGPAPRGVARPALPLRPGFGRS